MAAASAVPAAAIPTSTVPAAVPPTTGINPPASVTTVVLTVAVTSGGISRVRAISQLSTARPHSIAP